MPCAQDHWSRVEILCNLKSYIFRKNLRDEKKSKSSAYVEDKYQNVTVINITANLLAGYKWISLSRVVGMGNKLSVSIKISEILKHLSGCQLLKYDSSLFI